mmetsp:Transcript_7206/g.10977  ORF Transcript_7206/g.10977 Transcript_7206/m.10977 type:complete len:521 (-) Transcript_7206:93-1655(-)|eukprot:CAMPEP_0167754738 /NCGR_PEP_ID=MMETSP0110_2-20121227/8440_1 /TAXON_ID=629695 /ORGANISM="Gymnochlora sp., Strain CCMP2014" /LENGTH=520 /DNA_ID=CAMNT_0007640657 /DNA_START=13 /DNA_END=1575 /DNA_ORIENTATION=-
MRRRPQRYSKPSSTAVARKPRARATIQYKILLGDRVIITQECRNNSLTGQEARVLTLPRWGQRLVRTTEGQVVSVPTIALLPLPLPVSDKRVAPKLAEPYHEYFVPDIKARKAAIAERQGRTYASKAVQERVKARIDASVEEMKNSVDAKLTLEDPSQLTTFTIAIEDAMSVWEFEKAATVKDLRKWMQGEAKDTKTVSASKDKKMRLLAWKSGEEKGSGAISGKDGRDETITEKQLQTQLNMTASFFQTRGTSEKVALIAALTLGLNWCRVHKLKEAIDLMVSVTRSVLSQSDIQYHLALFQISAFSHYKTGNAQIAETLYKKLISMAGKIPTLAVRENLGFSLLSQATGKSLIEAEAVLTEVLYSNPQGDPAGAPSPPASALSFAAAVDTKIFKKLIKSRLAGLDLKTRKISGTLFALAICKYLRGQFTDAMALIEESLKGCEYKPAEGKDTKAGDSLPIAEQRKQAFYVKVLCWYCVIGKESGRDVTVEKGKIVKLLKDFKLDQHRICTNILELLEL